MYRFGTGLLLLASITFLGCGTGESVTPVTGTVTVDGQPLDGASISFLPEAGTKAGVGGSAKSDSSGKYSVKTAKGSDGLPPGKYTITVTKSELKDPSLAEGGGVTEADLIHYVPKKYNSPETSGLSTTVDTSPHTFDIKLEGGKK